MLDNAQLEMSLCGVVGACVGGVVCTVIFASNPTTIEVEAGF